MICGMCGLSTIGFYSVIPESMLRNGCIWVINYDSSYDSKPMSDDQMFIQNKPVTIFAGRWRYSCLCWPLEFLYSFATYQARQSSWWEPARKFARWYFIFTLFARESRDIRWPNYQNIQLTNQRAVLSLAVFTTLDMILCFAYLSE